MKDDTNAFSSINTSIYNVVWENDQMAYNLTLATQQDRVINYRDDTPYWNMHELKSKKPQTHTIYEIEYILSGSGIQSINGKEYTVRKGDIIFIYTSDKHMYYPDDNTESFGVLNCVFPQIPVGQEEKLHNIPYVLSLSSGAIIEIDQIFQKMELEFQNKDAGYQDFLNSYLNLLIAILYRDSHKEMEKNAHLQSNIVLVLEYIENNFTHITMKDCADFLSYSSSYFSKFFKASVGVTVSEYINGKKLQVAVTLLAETDQPVEIIIQKSGFSHRKHFYQTFKNFTGMTPMEYRKRHRKKSVTPAP